MHILPGRRARKYLLYACGEIALVVIGILIALQVNDWNEARKQAGRRRAVLVRIEQEIGTNRARVDDAMPRRRAFLTELERVSAALTEEQRRRPLYDVPEAERFAGWPGASPVVLDGAMYEAAKFGGVLAELDSALLAQLTGLYSRQELLNDLGGAFVHELTSLDYGARHGDAIRLLWRIQEEFFGGQYLLMKDYDAVLDALRTQTRS